MFDKTYYENKRNSLETRMVKVKDRFIMEQVENVKRLLSDQQEIQADYNEVVKRMQDDKELEDKENKKGKKKK